MERNMLCLVVGLLAGAMLQQALVGPIEPPHVERLVAALARLLVLVLGVPLSAM